MKHKRILFRVIGNNEVGLGHVYRALSLAHEMSGYDVLFVTDVHSSKAVTSLVRKEYWLGIYDKAEILDKVVALKPDVVVNDVLDTTECDVAKLKKNNIRVINFEDLGSGARVADLTINELYDEPKFSGGNIRWGKKYFFVRDEFVQAKPNAFLDVVQAVLLTFGGTDQHDLSRKIYESIKSVCEKRNVNIHIVTGPGYENYRDLELELIENDSVQLTHATGVISRIMEKVQLAVTSNGRTVYELAHMNVPSIVVSQHDRERTHEFANKENGVIPVGLYCKTKTELKVKNELENLITSTQERKKLFDNIEKYSFVNNKQKVVDLIRYIGEGGNVPT